MLAKQYNFPYETLTLLSTVEYESKRLVKPLVCKEGCAYPLWNAELLIDTMNTLKYRLKKELDTRDPHGKMDKGRRNKLIKEMTYDLIKGIHLSLIVEDGYKAYFTFDESGECQIDLTSLNRMNHLTNQILQLNIFIYRDETIDLAEICPEYWFGQWKREKCAL